MKLKKNLGIKLSNEKWNPLHKTLFIALVLSCIDIVIIGMFVKDFRNIFPIAMMFYTHCLIAIILGIILYLDTERIRKLEYDKKQSENNKV